MNGLSVNKSLIFIILIVLASPAFSEDIMCPNGNLSNWAGETLNFLVQKKKAKVKKPGSAKKAQKKADAKEKKRDQDYAKFVKESRNHAQEIQTPAVRERMKQNIKDSNANVNIQITLNKVGFNCNNPITSIVF